MPSRSIEIGERPPGLRAGCAMSVASFAAALPDDIGADVARPVIVARLRRLAPWPCGTGHLAVAPLDLGFFVAPPRHEGRAPRYAPTDPKASARRMAIKRRNAAAIALIESWLADESGYDEEVWPRIKASIEENRLSRRHRFDRDPDRA